MNAQELYEEWTDGESPGIRPQRAKQVREELAEYTGYPIPRRLPAIEALIEGHKPQISKRLREAAEETDDPADEPPEAVEGDEA